MWVCRRQKELEEKLIEEEVARRVEELVAKRVEEELEKRKEEIEAEVLRRVEEAKKIMELQMLNELETQRQAELEAQKKKEVNSFLPTFWGTRWHVHICFPGSVRAFSLSFLLLLSSPSLIIVEMEGRRGLVAIPLIGFGGGGGAGRLFSTPLIELLLEGMGQLGRAVSKL